MKASSRRRITLSCLSGLVVFIGTMVVIAVEPGSLFEHSFFIVVSALQAVLLFGLSLAFFTFTSGSLLQSTRLVGGVSCLISGCALGLAEAGILPWLGILREMGVERYSMLSGQGASLGLLYFLLQRSRLFRKEHPSA